MKYHNNFGNSFVISTDLCEAYLILETIIKNPLKITISFEKKRNKTGGAINVGDLDEWEDGVMSDDELHPSLRTKKKTLGPIPDELRLKLKINPLNPFQEPCCVVVLLCCFVLYYQCCTL
ncbi:unnamed protein product [Vicia faba]|uniref:Uncharacterized protein n=1 Tax=Vicia faba TaxID=3906 RepID=A0AAV1AXF5_VICFA|nr:unnamed protein product [Vicia faba]